MTLPRKTRSYLDAVFSKSGICVERTSYGADFFRDEDPQYIVKDSQDGCECARVKVFSFGHRFVSYSITTPGHSEVRVLVRPARKKHSPNAQYVMGLQTMLEQKLMIHQQ